MSAPSDPTGSTRGWYRDLVVATARALEWKGFVAATAVSLLFAAMQRWAPDRADPVLTYLAILVIAASMAAVLDDDAATILTTSTTPHRRRLLIRAILGLAAGAVSLTAFIATMLFATGAAHPWDSAGLWLALSTVTVAIAAIATRLLPHAPAALVASGTLLSVGVVIFATPPIHAVAELSQLALWDDSWERLTWTFSASLAAFLWASRDPASRRRRIPRLQPDGRGNSETM